VNDEALIVLVGGLGVLMVPVILAVARRKGPRRKGDAGGGAFMIDGGDRRDSDGGDSGSDGGADGGGD
jgi:hypothetical protein